MKSSTPHLHLLNVLKICALIAIQVFHTCEFLYFEDDFHMGGSTFIDFMLTYFSRFFTLGGQILVAIIFFLFGMHEKPRTFLFRVVGFCLLGQLILLSIFQTLEWDIYGFLFLTVLILALIPIRFRSSRYLLLPCALICAVPVTHWQELFPAGEFYDLLTGRFSMHHSAAWAPLPWSAFALLFVGLGAVTQKHIGRMSIWHKWEFLLWGILLGWTIPWLGEYYATPIGPRYYDFSFNKPSWIFWANFLPFVFWMRLSLLSRVQLWASSNIFFRWLSGLMWNRKVGVIYIVALVYLGIGSSFSDELRATPIFLDLFLFCLMPVCEVVVRFFTARLSGVRLPFGRGESSES